MHGYLAKVVYMSSRLDNSSSDSPKRLALFQKIIRPQFFVSS